MTKEEAIKFANCLKNNYTIDFNDMDDFCDMAIKALEIVEEFERAQIIIGGRLNGRTYAYKCGLEDGKRKALEQQSTSDDCVSRKAMLNAITEIDDNINMDIYTNEVREIVKELPAATPTQRWISVSERLPEDRNLVLVTAYWHETYQVMMASYYGNGLWWCVPFNNCGNHMQKLNPIAWQPLPQPYEKKRGNENAENI